MEQQNYREVFATLLGAIGKPVLIEKPIQSTDLGAFSEPDTQIQLGVLERASGNASGGTILVVVSGVEVLLSPFAPGVIVSVYDSTGEATVLFGQH